MEDLLKTSGVGVLSLQEMQTLILSMQDELSSLRKQVENSKYGNKVLDKNKQFFYPGSTFTGGMFRTAVTGQRIEVMDNQGLAGFPHELVIYPPSGTPMEVFGGADYFYFKANLAVKPISFENQFGLQSLVINEEDITVGGLVRLANLTDSEASSIGLTNGSMYYSTTSNALKVYINGTLRTVTVT